jgi:hypothetical protein
MPASAEKTFFFCIAETFCAKIYLYIGRHEENNFDA